MFYENLLLIFVYKINKIRTKGILKTNGLSDLKFTSCSKIKSQKNIKIEGANLLDPISIFKGVIKKTRINKKNICLFFEEARLEIK